MSVGHGPVIAVAGTFTGTIVGDRNVSQGFADFFTVRDGLILARQTYFDSPAV
jgi:ketosteroid isomerase-like protein